MRTDCKPLRPVTVMSAPLRLLLIEDSDSDAKLVIREISRAGYTVDFTRVQDGAAVRAALEGSAWDAITSDWSMPGFDALDALAIAKELRPDLPFIIVSGTVGEEKAADAMRAGAHDYVLKDRLARLVPALEREIRDSKSRAGRRRAEDALHDSEGRYRILFDKSPMPKWLYDLESLRFLEVNEAAIAHYGYSRDEFLQMSIKDIRPAEDIGGFLESLGQHTRAAFHRDRYRHRKKDGSSMDVEITAHTFLLQGRAARLVVVQDITARRQAEEALRRSEEQLRQAQKMEAIGQLTGGVAHDFNNILSIILSYSALILEDLPRESPMHRDLLEIKAAGDRAADLTRQLLAFSRRQILQPRIVDLNAILSGMEKMLRRLIGEDVELTTSPAPDSAKANVDPGQIEQVMMNLVVNARDAMPGGGKLTIEIARTELDSSDAADHAGVPPGSYVRVAVSDTGLGMDEQTQARIFEPFFTTKEVGKGTGLGLSTVLGIVQQSGGHVAVDSEPGRGTTFRIYFPQAGDEPLSRGREARARHIGTWRGGETILLVEDDERLRRVTRTMLNRYGYTVLEAQSGGDALLICERQSSSIQLLLTDVVMPHMSGPDLAARLVAARPGLGVVFMSGYTDDAILRHGILDASAAFVQKPFTPEALLRKVREALDLRPGASRNGAPEGRSSSD
jgi:two-component system cell cycle sensor histidine kinase/response regulator CckA